MARVSGFGQTGPYAQPGRLWPDRRGDGRAARDHRRSPTAAGARGRIDRRQPRRGARGVMGILMALHAREASGRGQIVDAAIYESVLAMMENMVTEYDITGYVRERSGSILPGIAPSNVYPAAGGEMILIGGNGDTVFRRLATLIGQPELADDPRFASHITRGDEPGAARRHHRRVDPKASAAGRCWRDWRRKACRAAGSSAPPTCWQDPQYHRPRRDRHHRPSGLRRRTHAEYLPENVRDSGRGPLARSAARRAYGFRAERMGRRHARSLVGAEAAGDHMIFRAGALATRGRKSYLRGHGRSGELACIARVRP